MNLGEREGTELHTVSREVAQRAVGRVSLRDVLRSLQRAHVVSRYRVKGSVVEIEAPVTLGVLIAAPELFNAERPAVPRRCRVMDFASAS
jgi:DNA-binding FadR family transcriptional regulator